jgi:hypothetical protein
VAEEAEAEAEAEAPLSPRPTTAEAAVGRACWRAIAWRTGGSREAAAAAGVEEEKALGAQA